MRQLVILLLVLSSNLTNAPDIELTSDTKATRYVDMNPNSVMKSIVDFVVNVSFVVWIWIKSLFYRIFIVFRGTTMSINEGNSGQSSPSGSLADHGGSGTDHGYNGHGNLGQEGSVHSGDPVDRRCMDCLCEIESNCERLGCRMDVGSLSCGYYQIKKPYYLDCGQPGKQNGESTDVAWERCSRHKPCAESCVQAYIRRYAQRCSSVASCEIYARIHNGGPKGCRAVGTIGYWRKIEKCLKRL